MNWRQCGRMHALRSTWGLTQSALKVARDDGSHLRLRLCLVAEVKAAPSRPLSMRIASCEAAEFPFRRTRTQIRIAPSPRLAASPHCSKPGIGPAATGPPGHA